MQTRLVIMQELVARRKALRSEEIEVCPAKGSGQQAPALRGSEARDSKLNSQASVPGGTRLPGACTQVLPGDAERTVGRKALHFARGSDRAHRRRGRPHMQAPCSVLSRTLGAAFATMRLHRGCKGHLPSRSGFSQRAARPWPPALPALPAPCCTKSSAAKGSLGCRTPRVHRRTDSWGRGSPTNWGWMILASASGGRDAGNAHDNRFRRPDRVESLGGERLSLARPRAEVERATARPQRGARMSLCTQHAPVHSHCNAADTKGGAQSCGGAASAA